MIDFHTHILPGMDDGSPNEETTSAMLLEESRQGVAVVAATPHFYAKRMSIDDFMERRASAMARTARVCERADMPLPGVVAGAEVYYFQGMGQAKAISRLCVGETRTLLVELPFSQWDEEVLRDVESLITRQKLNVVLAHIERYVGFQKDRRAWDRVTALPLTPQINAESLLNPGGLFRSNRRRRFCLDFLKAHPNAILGSDCHNMGDRPPNLALARAEIVSALGKDALQRIDDTAREALAGSGRTKA